MATDDIKIKATLDDGVTPKLKGMTKEADKTGSSLNGLGSKLTKASVALAAFAAAGKTVDFMADAYKAAKESEIGQAKLAAALGKTSTLLNEQSAALSKKTRFDDDAITSAQALLANYVKNEQAISALTPAVMDLAEATGQDLNTAAAQVARAIADDNGELGKYKIALNGAAGSSERMNSAIAGLDERFGGQKDAIGKAAGEVDQLKKAFGEMVEDIGKKVAPAVDEVARALREMFFYSSIDRKEQLKDIVAAADRDIAEYSRAVEKGATGCIIRLEESKAKKDKAMKEFYSSPPTAPATVTDVIAGTGETSDEKYKRQKAAFDKQQDLVKEGEDICTRAAANAINAENKKTAALSNSLDEQVEIRKKAAEDTKRIDEELAENARLLAEAEAASAQKAADAKMEQQQRTAQGAWDAGEMVMQSMIDVAKASNASAKEMQALQIAQAAMNGASAVVSIWSQAGQLGPIAGPIVAGIETAAIIAMTAAQIATISQQKFATGGIISGPSSGDMVSVRGNGGEAVMTTSQQKRLLAIADGSGSGYGGPSITIAPQVRVDSGMSASEKRRLINATAETTRDALKQLIRTNRLPAGLAVA